MGLLFTSSVTGIRLKAWMAASCTASVVAGCLMHFVSTVLMLGLAASSASPMLPTTWMRKTQAIRKSGKCNSFGLKLQNTHPQGQESQIFVSSAVLTQDGGNEFGHSNNLRGDSLSLIESGDKAQKKLKEGKLLSRLTGSVLYEVHKGSKYSTKHSSTHLRTTLLRAYMMGLLCLY